jgi:hypothetical protein
MNNQRKEIARINNLSYDELLEELGMSLTEKEYYGFADFKIRAKEWLQEKKGVIYTAICAEDQWPTLKKRYKKHEINDAFLLAADVWLAPYFAGLPILTIAKLLVFEGLDNICGCE